ncbi:MAG: flagellar basal-body MS-ring/collar protein FliF [Rubricoccaceae bacterium]
MTDLLAQARAALQQLTPQRRLLLGGVVVGVVGLLLLVGRWATQPDYALLFGDMPAPDAGRVVEQLDTEGITYDLRDGGTSIYVPRSEVYGLRLRLATNGVMSHGTAGYELFDGGTLGMTDFMQKLNVKRALEGELSRTISSIQQVESARVHLVLPERSPFRDQQTAASASVVLSVRGTLAPDQVAGVTGLVAGAVEGMSPSEVTVLDEAGRMLASPQMANGSDAGMSTTQVQMRQEIERHLSDAGQSMLDQMLGPGKAVVRVAADLDLARTSTETNSVDPEAQVLISEERQSETGANNEAESSVRNFDVTRQTQRTEREAGAIQALTISVLLDEAAPPVEVARPQEDEEGEAAPTPFSDEQLRQIEALVKNAVGFNEERGDQFAVQQIRFQAPEVPEDGFFAAGQGAIWVGMGLRYGVLLLALFLAYRVFRRMTDALAAPPETPDATDALSSGDGSEGENAPDRQLEGESPEGLPETGPPTTTIETVEGDPYAAKLSVEATQQLASTPDLIEDVRAAVVDSPDAAASVVKTWLKEDAEAPLLS